MGFTFNNRELIVNVSIDEVNEAGGLDSTAPSGKCAIINTYYDQNTDEQVVERSDTPEP